MEERSMAEWPHWTLQADGTEATRYWDTMITLQPLPNGRVRLQAFSAREDGEPPCIAPFWYDFVGAEQARKFARDVIRGGVS